MLQTIVLIAHVLIAVFIVGLVLLQRGKGADAGAAFGAGASGTVFGARGSSNFLSRSTAVLATLFFLSSLTLAYFSAQRPESGSLMERSAPASGESVISPLPQDAGRDDDLPVLDQPPAAEDEDENDFAPNLD